MSDELKPDLRHRLPASWTRERRGALVRELRSAATPRRRRWWTRGLVVIPAMAVLAAGSAAAVIELVGDTPVIEEAGCYPRVDRHATPTAFAQAADPVASCRQEWRAGHVAPTTTAPPLVACLAGTQARVYPGDGPEVCDRLGLKPLPAQFAGQARRSADFEARMRQRLQDCPSIARAKQIAHEELVRAGRADWVVRLTPGQRKPRPGDCIDNFGTAEIEGEPSAVELDLRTSTLSGPAEDRLERRMKRAGCKDGEAPDVDGALAATECHHDLLAHCVRPSVAATELRRQLAARGLTNVVRVDFDSPNRCWGGFQRDGEAIVLMTNPRPSGP
jgi:hypothetical protein